MIKKTILTLILGFLMLSVYSKKVEFEEINVPVVENPVSFCLSYDGLKMILIERGKKDFITIKESIRPHLESSWGIANPLESITSLLKEDVVIDAPFLSYDGKKLFFSANFSDSKGGMDIYYCNWENNAWSVPINLGAPFNTERDENHPSLSGNRRMFLFTRDVELKKLENFNTGEFWLSELDQKNEKWKTPEKLNKALNDGGIAYPKIADDNKTILYSRILNDNDKWNICHAMKYKEKHWILPKEIDTLSINESIMSPVYSYPENMLYFTINKNDDKKPKCTLYRTKLLNNFAPQKTIKVSGSVLDKSNKVVPNATILVTNPVTAKVLNLLQPEKDGSYNMILNADEEYMFHVFSDGYAHKYHYFAKDEAKENIVHNFIIFPITSLCINVYDQEELQPLNATIGIRDNEGNTISVGHENERTGHFCTDLEIGKDYTIFAEMDYYFSNKMTLELSNIVLFDEFVRDIELKPKKKNIQIQVLSEEDDSPISANIIFKEDRRQKKFYPTPVAGHTGKFEIEIKDGEAFGIDAYGMQGYAFKHIRLDLSKERDIETLEIKLKPLKRKVPIQLHNINFEFNSADLLETSFPELNRVARLIEENPDIKIEIIAHADDKGTDEYNLKLSGKRANSAVEYLLTLGIAPKRLIAIGYGESMPLVPNDSEENRAINRRVEMKILDLNDNETILEEEVDYE